MVDIIVQLLKYLGLALIVGGIFFCAVFAMSHAMMAGRGSREDEEAGAPEGALNFSHFQCPDASGSKLSVRASYQSVHSNQVSVQSPGGRLD